MYPCVDWFLKETRKAMQNLYVLYRREEKTTMEPTMFVAKNTKKHSNMCPNALIRFKCGSMMAAAPTSSHRKTKGLFQLLCITWDCQHLKLHSYHSIPFLTHSLFTVMCPWTVVQIRPCDRFVFKSLALFMAVPGTMKTGRWTDSWAAQLHR